MSLETTLKRVREFFGTKGQAGLVLPNGWFGRPYDNLYELNWSGVVEDQLVLKLDNEHSLTLAGPTIATVKPDNLLLSRFQSAKWDWVEYGSTKRNCDEFFEGEVAFMAIFS